MSIHDASWRRAAKCSTPRCTLRAGHDGLCELRPRREPQLSGRIRPEIATRLRKLLALANDQAEGGEHERDVARELAEKLDAKHEITVGNNGQLYHAARDRRSEKPVWMCSRKGCNNERPMPWLDRGYCGDCKRRHRRPGQSAWRKRQRAARRAAGLCVECGEVAEHGSLCRRHYLANQRRVRKQRARKKKR